jgi:C4-dicarboxylate transporter, DctQ subunit
MLARVINGLEEGIISLLLVTMTLLVFMEVLLRYGFGIGFLWVQELTLHMSAWLVLFGASYGVKVGSHIGVDAIVRLLSSKVRRIVTLVALALCLVYCGLFIEGAWVYLAKMYKIGIHLEDLPIPKYAAHSILLIGFVMLFIRFVQLGWSVFKGDVDGFRLADEAKEALQEVGADHAPAAAGRETKP